MATLEGCKMYVGKPRNGGPAVILDSNDASAGRLTPGNRIGELEGSGMTEPGGSAGSKVWEGDIVEEDDNREYDGEWRSATALEDTAWHLNGDVFPLT